jgi:class 3 adenylate cyclase
VAGLLTHAVVYAVVNGLLVLLWVLLGFGTWSDLREVVQDPSTARTLEFWPIWPILLWGAALLIHAGVVVSYGLFGRKARKRRREMVANAAEHIQRHKADHRAERESRRPSRRRAGTDRQWVVVMFTDIARSTPLAESLGDDAWAEMLLEHRRLVRSCVRSHDGEEVGTQGDGFLVRFTEPDAAVGCAVTLQQELENERGEGPYTPSIRVGIHAGEAVHNEEDVVGRVVNLASRVVDAAEPNEILVTEPVADHLTTGVTLSDRGLKELKGITQPRHLLAVEWRQDDAGLIVLSEDDAAPAPE